MGRAGRIGFELLPQPADEHAQVLHFFRLRRTPDFAQQISVSQYLAGMADEHAEEIELLWRQFDLLSAASDVPAYQIYGQITGCESRQFALRLESMSQGGADARHQLRDRGRLCDVVVSSEIERLDLGAFVGACRQNDNRHWGMSADIGDDLEPASVRQPEIE